MRDTLEDLYYGNITPCDKRIKPGTTLQQTLDEAEQCEEPSRGCWAAMTAAWLTFTGRADHGQTQTIR